ATGPSFSGRQQEQALGSEAKRLLSQRAVPLHVPEAGLAEETADLGVQVDSLRRWFLFYLAVAQKAVFDVHPAADRVIAAIGEKEDVSDHHPGLLQEVRQNAFGDGGQIQEEAGSRFQSTGNGLHKTGVAGVVLVAEA